MADPSPAAEIAAYLLEGYDIDRERSITLARAYLAQSERVAEMEQLIGMMWKHLREHPHPDTGAVWFVFERGAASLLSADARALLTQEARKEGA